MSLQALAQQLGLKAQSGGLKLSRIERGEVKIEADLAEKIRKLSDDAVLPQDHHDERLEFIEGQKQKAKSREAAE
ncbi:hypothetical protein [Pararhizobium sp.]|uniref:hypothetical protein n=1 Tax=Pararhizobium sp. TaxID=1977563 RepID=UPI003D09CCC2